jgi:transposase
MLARAWAGVSLRWSPSRIPVIGAGPHPKRSTGRDEPAFANCGRKPTLTAEQRQQLRRIAGERPDAFLSELADEFDAQLGVRACRQTVGRWLRELGITRKKSRSTPRNSSVPMSKRSVTPGPPRSPTPAGATTPA